MQGKGPVEFLTGASRGPTDRSFLAASTAVLMIELDHLCLSPLPTLGAVRLSPAPGALSSAVGLFYPGSTRMLHCRPVELPDTHSTKERRVFSVQS